MNGLGISADRLEHAAVRRVAPYRETLLRLSIELLRISLGLVFILFGALKFVPGLSPAEELATRTVERLTFGLMPDGWGIIGVAIMETTIGLSLLTGRYLRLGLGLLAVAMVGVLSPLALFPDELFSGPGNGPTLAAQYVFKDIVLLAAGLVVAAYALGGHPAAARDARAREQPAPQPRRIGPMVSEQTRRRIAAAMVLALLAGSVGDAGADAAKLAADAATSCVAPPLAQDTPTPAEPELREATPVVLGSGAEHAADAITTEEAVTAVETIFACFEAGQHQTVAMWFTPNFIRAELGLDDPADAPAILAGFFPFAVEAIGDVRQHSEDRVSADVVYRREEGQHMLVHERWHFARRDTRLLLDAIEPLPATPEGPVVDVAARMTDGGFELARTELARGAAIRFTVGNARPTANDFAVFRLPEGATVADVHDGLLPAGSQFMGAVFLAPGAQGELVLVDLPPGVYAVASFAEEQNRIQDTALGTPALLTVR